MKTPKILARFRENRKALAYVWGVICCTLILFPFIYWGLSLSLNSVAIAIFAQYPLVGDPASAWTLVKALISALPTFVVLICIAWGVINAKASAYEQ